MNGTATGLDLVTAPDGDQFDDVVLEQVAELVTPVLAAVGRLARVGRRALWLEVVDEMGLTLTHAPGLATDDSVVTRLGTLPSRPGTPWAKPPDVRVVDGPAGPLLVGRKAGCCLAYEVPEPEQDEEPTPYLLEYRRAFPWHPRNAGPAERARSGPWTTAPPGNGSGLSTTRRARPERV